MKVVHVLKKIESIDSDIKDLRKMEKSLQQNKSFTTPIYLSIEKQINILLDERIKMLGLTIQNPPDYMLEHIEDIKTESQPAAAPVKTAPKKPKARKSKPAPARREFEDTDDFETESIPLMTQDLIDEKIKNMRKEGPGEPAGSQADKNMSGSDTVKLLDIALEKGTLNKEAVEKEKKKVKFFKDNFPGGEY